MLVIGLVAFTGLVGYQVRSIIRSPFPGLRAIEALATSVPLYLALFASTYFVMARLSAGSYGGPLIRTDALYFTATVFSTVGFGQIPQQLQYPGLPCDHDDRRGQVHGPGRWSAHGDAVMGVAPMAASSPSPVTRWLPPARMRVRARW
jgi:hypothetical protein